MDPFARKMIRGAIAYGLAMLLMFAVLTAIYFHLRPLCPDRTLAQVESPEHHWMAAVLQRRCGDDAPFISHVNLRPASQALRRGFFSGQAPEGDVFVIEQDAAGAGLTLIWTAPDALTIACPQCIPAYIRRSDAQWGAIRIHYELPPR